MIHYGISPKMMLSTLRFKYCLQILMGNADEAVQDYLILQYYDNPHFIKDIKKRNGRRPISI